MGIRGVWSLENVELKKPVDDWVEIPNVFLTQDDIAHSRPYPTPNLQRWNLGNSTMTNTSLSCSRYWGQASGNTTFSYFAGGGISPGIIGQTSTDKLSYSPYTFAATPTANTTFPIRSGGALSSNLAAYITAAYNSTGSPSYNGSWVDKILFATDTKSTLSDKFGENGNSWASLSDGKGGGYNFNGDVPSPARAKLYKITYSTDGMAYVPASNTLTARRESSAEMMNPSAGYNTGGDLSGPISSTEKLSWSTGTWTAVPGGKLVRVTKRMASGSGRSHGFAGGGDGNVAPVYTDFYKLDFSTETFGRDPALNFLGSNHGYYPQKSTTTPLDGLYGADKAFDRNSFWSGDNGKRWFDSALGGSYGVGFDGSGDYLQMASSSDLTFGTGDFTIEFYVNATNFTNRGTFYDSRPSGGNTGITIGHEASSGEIRVYMNAGHGGDIVVQSTDFTTGVWYHIAVTRSSGTVRLFINGVLKDTETPSERDMNNTNVVNIGYKTYSSSGYNYLNGTISSFRVLKGTALYTSNFDRPIIALTNISDTKLLCCQSSSSTTTKEVGPTITANGDPTVILSQTLPTGPPAPTPTPSSTPQSPAPISPTAFFMAGRDPGPSEYSSCGKIQFASETRSALPGSNIPARKFVCGTSSTLAGYCFGDSNQVAKLLYATDASSTLPSTLPGGYRYKSAISNDTVAFTFGGWQNYSTIDKLTFSNDTVSANTPTNRPPENLRYFTGQLSGPSKGYFCTGATAPSYPGRDKKCHYITFATDSGSEGPEAPEIRDAVGSCSNATVGYITGGRGPGSPQEKSNTSKFTFATESWSNVPGAPLSAATYALSGTSNQTFAYFSGGSTGGAGPAVKTTSRKFTFASETMGPGTSLDVPRWGFGYTANTESNHPQTTPQPNIPHVI